MNDQNAFLIELGRQQAADPDRTSQNVADVLGWEFERTSQLLERLENQGLVKITPPPARAGNTHLDHWVALTSKGRAIANAAGKEDNQISEDSDLKLDRWSRIDLPVLRELAKASERDDGTVLVDAIADRIGIRPRDVMKAYDNLHRTGFVDSHFTHDSGGEYFGIKLSQKALETTELWPTAQSALDRMIAALDAIAENTDDTDTRTTAQKFAAWLRTTSTTVGLSVASTVLTGQMPGSQ